MEAQKPNTDLPKAKASDLSAILKSPEDDARERLEGEKTVTIKLSGGKKPIVTFTGFWTGKFIRIAQNAIAKGFRQRRVQLKKDGGN